MELINWSLYAVLALSSIATPGPAILFVVNNSIIYGPNSVYKSSVGNSLGLFVHSCIAYFGLSVLAEISEDMFYIVKVIGSLYLIYLGFSYFRSSLNSIGANEKCKTYFTTRYLVITGLLISLSNPKPIIFFISIFPLFITKIDNMHVQYLILTFTFVVISNVVLLIYGFLSRGIVRGGVRSISIPVIRKISGTIFMVTGFSLIINNFIL